ncbi:MAG: M23 family metallopeptidase, partial [Candidatus Eisenbacteria bacterium]
MPQSRSTRDILASLAIAAFLLTGSAANVQAQGELEKTPWATTMVFPVGDPIDYGLPAPGEKTGFQLSRGLQSRGDKHEGLDLSNRASGGEIRAVAPGLVVCTRTGWAGGWGNMVVLAHRMPGGDLLFSLFAHMLPGSIAVREGEVVALGQPLGRIGSTGHSSGPHLHLEFREIAQTRPLFAQPLAEAWMKATIVDPLRMLSIMMPRGGSNPLLAALPAAARVGTASDPLLALVQRGALAPSALDHGDEALTRGELYRLAFAALSAPGARPAARWSTLRPRLLRLTPRLPAASRTAFAAARLPRREAEAGTAASLDEVVTVFIALERA